MHALIIEDEFLIAMTVELALRECGFTTFEHAMSADDAIASASRRCPDLITADVELQPGCGITAVQAICSRKAIPVIFITGTPDQVRIRMPGHTLVEKPFDTYRVSEAVKLALGERWSP